MDVFQPVDGSLPYPLSLVPCSLSPCACSVRVPLFPEPLHSLLSLRSRPHSVRALTRSISAIMRGAVLYKLGLDFVKDRIIRKSYGVAMNVAFRPGHHPNSRKVTSLDGVVRCEDVMHWYAYKVRSPSPVCVRVSPLSPLSWCMSPGVVGRCRFRGIMRTSGDSLLTRAVRVEPKSGVRDSFRTPFLSQHFACAV